MQELNFGAGDDEAEVGDDGLEGEESEEDGLECSGSDSEGEEDSEEEEEVWEGGHDGDLPQASCPCLPSCVPARLLDGRAGSLALMCVSRHRQANFAEHTGMKGQAISFWPHGVLSSCAGCTGG